MLVSKAIRNNANPTAGEIYEQNELLRREIKDANRDILNGKIAGRRNKKSIETQTTSNPVMPKSKQQLNDEIIRVGKSRTPSFKLQPPKDTNKYFPIFKKENKLYKGITAPTVSSELTVTSHPVAATTINPHPDNPEPINVVKRRGKGAKTLEAEANKIAQAKFESTGDETMQIEAVGGGGANPNSHIRFHSPETTPVKLKRSNSIPTADFNSLFI
jgi:hypothetical protein